MSLSEKLSGRWTTAACLALILVVALFFRTAGLFRGLEVEIETHPDVPKQIQRLQSFLGGEYNLHYGNYFYDGYPYGLNRVDEGLIRLVSPAVRAWRAHAMAQPAAAGKWSKLELYYWARCLRVLYGMLAVLATYFIMRRLAFQAAEALLATLLAAVAPLAVTVSHLASGDVGVDLFVAGTLLCTGLYIRRPRSFWWMGGAGGMIGLAFASKYQGLLVAWVPVGVLIGEARSGQGRKAAQALAALVAGCVAAVLAANPLFLIEPVRTGKEILINFEVISRYRAHHVFAQQTALERLSGSFLHNAPMVADALGWSVCAAGLLGLIFSLRRLFGAGREESSRSVRVLRAATYSFPFLALVLFLAGKPVVQPFHFSSLQVPLILAALYGVDALWTCRGRLPRWLSVLALIAMTAELAHGSLRDDFFWRREDTREVGDHMVDRLFDPFKVPRYDLGLIRTLFLEPVGLSVFRNEEKAIVVPPESEGRPMDILPAPCIPYPVSHIWVFVNGPQFLRNDRMWEVSRGMKVEKDLVMERRPDVVTLGLRSGAMPAELAIRSGWRTVQAVLQPNDWTLLDVPVARVQTSGKACILPLHFEAKGGSVWVELLGDDREAAHFETFSGAYRSGWLPQNSPSGLLEQVEQCRFLEGRFDDPILRTGEHLPVLEAALPAGPYRLELLVAPLDKPAELTLDYRVAQRPGEILPPLHPDMERTWRIEESTTLTTRFTKTFAPYQVAIDLVGQTGSCLLIDWRLTPDAAALLNVFTNGSVGAAWLTSPGPAPAFSQVTSNVWFGRTVRLLEARVPDTAGPQALGMSCHMQLKRVNELDLADAQVFLHYLDAQGEQVAAAGLPLYDVLAGDRSGAPWVTFKPDKPLESGRYDLYMGIYDKGKDRRLKPASFRGKPAVSDRRVCVGQVVVR